MTNIQRFVGCLFKEIIEESNKGWLLELDHEEDAKTLIEKELKKLKISLADDSVLQAIKNDINEHDSYNDNPIRWSRLYGLIESINRELAEKEKLKSESSDSEETETETEPADDDDTEDDDMTQRFSQIKDGFSYIPQVVEKFKIIVQENKIIHHHYHFSVNVYTNVKILLQKAREKIKKISEFLGIAGMFLALKKLMKRFKFVDILVRTLGTIIILIVSIVALIIAIFKWAQDPIQRFLNGMARLLGIKIEDD